MITKIIAAVLILLIAFIIYKQKDQIKALFEESKQAPQHWGTFIGLMIGVLLFVYLLIKL